jgi:hypothetical protein
MWNIAMAKGCPIIRNRLDNTHGIGHASCPLAGPSRIVREIKKKELAVLPIVIV